MSVGETLALIFFFLLLAFAFAEFQQAIIDAGFTGTLAVVINNLPLVFIVCAGVVPFVYLGRRD